MLRKFYILICFFVGIVLCPTLLRAQNVDINLLKKINPPNPNSIAWKGVSNSMYPISSGAPIALLIVGYAKNNKELKKNGWELFAASATNFAITMGLKYSVNRDRPFVTYPNDITPNETPTDPSFPSGHASMAFTTATTITLMYPKWYVAVPAYAWAAGVSYSRLYLGLHYPSDVLIGAALGTGTSLLCHWLNKKYFNKYFSGKLY